MFWTIFRIASMLGLGATVERWFSPGTDNSGNNKGGFNGFVILLAVAAVIYFVYSLIGKTIRIGK
jgi:hypothetical protein